MKWIFLLFVLCGFCPLSAETAEKEEPEGPPAYLYKVISPKAWQVSQRRRVLQIQKLDNAFIHLASEEQLPHVTEKFWKGQDYVVLKIDTKQLVGRLVHETNPGGSNKYYHLYDGYIPIKAVVGATPSSKR